MIVFFAAIREILKKEIYAADKAGFCAMKTKAELAACGIFSARLQIRRICFVNRSEMENEPISRLGRIHGKFRHLRYSLLPKLLGC
ncbi:MAG TPA: hypothetical protein VF133_15525 [Terriglobales bacterium]